MTPRDPEKRRAYAREYSARNRERIRLQAREYRRRNLDKLRAYDRERYQMETSQHRTERPYRPQEPVPVATELHTVRGLAWAAGFLEGEGSFNVSGATGTGTRVSVAQVQREPLERMQRMFGGRIARRTQYANQKPCSEWSLYGPRARGVMLTMYPMMSPRRKEQIRLALAAWVGSKAA